MHKRLIGFSRFAVFLLVSGCGGGGRDTTAPPGPIASVTVGGPATNVVVNGTLQLSATPKDANGTTLSGLPAASWASSNTAAATVGASTGLVTGVAVGSTNITATISGIVSAPKAITVSVAAATATVVANTSQQFQPPQVDITAGGTVTWTFQALTHNVTFDPGAAGTPANTGDQTNTSVSRTFTTAGTFTYHCTLHAGMNGSVIVH
jgi:plastocyanin